MSTEMDQFMLRKVVPKKRITKAVTRSSLNILKVILGQTQSSFNIHPLIYSRSSLDIFLSSGACTIVSKEAKYIYEQHP